MNEEKKTKIFKVKGSKGEIYEITLKFLMESKIIYFIDCTCPNFTGCTKDGKYLGRKRIKQNRNFSDAQYFAEPCKHLKPVIEMYERDFGFKLKKPQILVGDKYMTTKLKKEILERSGGVCELEFNGHRCENKAENFHRTQRGSNEGVYCKENVKHICNDHHKMIHSGEFRGSRPK